MIVSDSGGVQEEAALFGVPLAIPRPNIERPELVGTWCRLMGDAEAQRWLVEQWDDRAVWTAGIRAAGNPYRDEDAAHRVVAAIDASIQRRDRW